MISLKKPIISAATMRNTTVATILIINKESNIQKNIYNSQYITIEDQININVFIHLCGQLVISLRWNSDINFESSESRCLMCPFSFGIQSAYLDLFCPYSCSGLLSFSTTLLSFHRLVALSISLSVTFDLRSSAELLIARTSCLLDQSLISLKYLINFVVYPFRYSTHVAFRPFQWMHFGFCLIIALNFHLVYYFPYKPFRDLFRAVPE